MPVKYFTLIFSGVIFIMGMNVLLAIRDSKLYEKMEQRNQRIELLLNQS